MHLTQQTKLKAIFGGTFDPPHLGHLYPLLSVLDALNIDSCELIPSHIPVHKTASSSAQHRLAMTELFAQQDPRLCVNKIEIDRDTPSYSAHTISELSKQHPDKAICFIMGLDTFLGLPSWFLPNEVISKCHIIVMMRGDTLSEAHQLTAQRLMACLKDQQKQSFDSRLITEISPSLAQLLPKQVYLIDKITQNAQNQRINGILRASKQGEVVFILNKQTEISSTMIRRAIADGISIEQWLTPNIAKYIQTHRIYNA